MRPWQHPERRQVTQASPLTPNFPSSLPEYSFPYPFPMDPPFQARLTTATPTTSATSFFPSTNVTTIYQSTPSFNNPQNFPPYRPNYPVRGLDPLVSRLDERTTLTELQTQNSVQEVPAQPRRIPLDWDARYSDIKKFYKDENGNLEVTRGKMLETFGFDASVKQYKDKFTEWGLGKYLSAPKARWMLMKSEKRKREGKDTVFIHCYQECSLDRAERTVKRSKSNRNVPFHEDAPTPSGITYHTPQNVVPSPQNMVLSPPNVVPSPRNTVSSPAITSSLPLPTAQSVRWTPVPASTAQNVDGQSPQPPRLNWNGHTRRQLEEMPREALELERVGQIEMAESKYRTALDGLQKLLAPTHEETKKVAYQLVSFYAQHDRMGDADAVLDWMCEKHIERWGLNHKKTVDHLLHILEMFSRWSRVDDAITLISRAYEVFENSDSSNIVTDTRSTRSAIPWTRPLASLFGRPQTIDTAKAFDATDEPVMMNYQIGLAKTVQGEAAESLLLGLISQCNNYLEKLATQLIEAWHALIMLYQKSGNGGKASEALRKAEADFWKVANLESTWTGPQLDASVELAKLLVEAEQFESADSILLRVESDAEVLYGEDDDKTIRLLISIGIFLQDQQRWNDARPRFEHALAASMTWSGLDQDRTKRLQAALDNEHYEMEIRTSQNIESILRRDWPTPNDRQSTDNRRRDW